jgi:RNA polymerase sigma-70 factor (ECF subfamily)
VGTSINRADQRQDFGQGCEPVTGFAAIVRAHGPDLMRRAIWLTHRADDAWDLYQDTLERALRSHSNRIPTEKARNWLHIIMHNLFIDHCRAPAARARRPLTDCVLARLSVAEPVAEAWWWSLEQAEIDRAMSQLSLRLRDVFSMHLQGLCYSQIAAQLTIPLNTVATRLRRARHKLRSLLVASAGEAWEGLGTL